MGDLSVKQLKEENEALSRELAEAISERNQSAKYGLALVEDKTKLQSQFNQLEILYENTKHELKIAQEQNHKATTRSGIEQEEKLLNETAALETSLNTQIFDLENELQKARQELKQYQDENERLHNDIAELQKDREQREHECRKLRNENRDTKSSETKLCLAYAALEDENIVLQKQIAGLRQNQVDFESIQHELITLHDKMNYMNSALDEANKLKVLAEAEMKDTWKTLQVERENKQTLKKQLDGYLNRESIYHMKDLALRFQENDSNDDDDYADKSDETGIGSEASATTANSEASNHKRIDLYTEIQLIELNKAEANLEVAEKEKNRLSAELEGIRGKFEKLDKVHSSVITYCTDLEHHISNMFDLSSKPDCDSDHYMNHAKPHVNSLCELVHNWNWDSIDPELSGQQINQLNSKIVQLTGQNDDLKSDGDLLNNFLLKLFQLIESSQNETLVITDELAQLYQMMSTPNDQSPDKVLSDDDKIIDKKDDMGIESVRNGLKTNCISLKNLESLNDISLDLRNKIQTISDKAKYLSGAYENIKINNPSIEHELQEQGTTASIEEVIELQEQVIKLKSFLSTKREQIATLRTVLKSNKNSAELALNNLKDKYAKERALVSETMANLRSELRSLKQESLSFISAREMYASRCQEFANRIETLTNELKAADAEKRTLNQLLKLAVQQKIDLTQRLEDFEVREIEIRNMRRKRI